MPTTDAPDLRIAVMRLARRLRTQRASDENTPSQLAVLATLLRTGPATTGQLAQSERIQPPSMTRILNSLYERGLVERTTDPNDRRLVLYDVTPQARRMVQRDRQSKDRWLSEKLAELSPQEVEILEQAIPILNRMALD